MSHKRFERAIANAIKITLEELIECPDDYENEDFRKLAKALSKPPDQAMKQIGLEIMTWHELNPQGKFEDSLLGASLKDSWESVNWEELANKLARTKTKFLDIAETKLKATQHH